MKKLSIGQVAKMLGVRPETVNWYIAKGKLHVVERDPVSGWRLFDEAEVLKLKKEREKNKEVSMDEDK